MSENRLHFDRTVDPCLALSILSLFLLTETKITLLTLTQAMALFSKKRQGWRQSITKGEQIPGRGLE